MTIAIINIAFLTASLGLGSAIASPVGLDRQVPGQVTQEISIGHKARTGNAGTQFEISWFSIDGGGGENHSGSDFELIGTLGQAEVGEELSAPAFELTTGFWTWLEASRDLDAIIFRDGFESGDISHWK